MTAGIIGDRTWTTVLYSSNVSFLFESYKKLSFYLQIVRGCFLLLFHLILITNLCFCLPYSFRFPSSLPRCIHIFKDCIRIEHELFECIDMNHDFQLYKKKMALMCFRKRIWAAFTVIRHWANINMVNTLFKSESNVDTGNNGFSVFTLNRSASVRKRFVSQFNFQLVFVLFVCLRVYFYSKWNEILGFDLFVWKCLAIVLIRIYVITYLFLCQLVCWWCCCCLSIVIEN